MFGYFSYSSPSNSRPSSPASSTSSSLYSSYSISPLTISSNESSTQSPSCAFPSWPRRSSLDGSTVNEATSFISDDDLFPDVFDDSDCTPIPSPCRSPQLPPQTALISRSAVRDLLLLKEQQPKKQTRRRSSRKSRTNSSTKPMSPIQEVGE